MDVKQLKKMKVITIGKSSGNDIVISDSLVSEHHLQIIQDDTSNFRLAVFDSTNGTYVNGSKINGEISLKPTDVVRIGNTTLPWESYFIQTPPADVNPVSPIPESAEPEQSGAYGILILLLGIAALGVIGYIVINYFNTPFISIFNDMVGSGKLFLFPIYLRGASELELGGQWLPMIASAVLAIIANSINGGGSLSEAGRGMANFALLFAVIFIILALFAKQILEWTLDF
jgi:hypothetical protein